MKNTYTFNLKLNDTVSPKLKKIQQLIKKISPFDKFNKGIKKATDNTAKLSNGFKKIKGSLDNLNHSYTKNKQKIIALQRESLTASKQRKAQIKSEIRLINQENKELRESIRIEKKRKHSRPKIGKGSGTLGGLSMAKMGVAGVVYGAGKLLTNSVKSADVQQQAEAQVTAGIKSTNNAAGFSLDQFKGMASALQSKSLFGDEDILQNVTAQLQTFTNIAGDTFKNAQQNAIDMAAKKGMSLADTTNMIGKALNDPIKGVTALGRAGVQFTDQQKEQIKTYQEAGDLASAQAIIQKELQKEFGGSAEAAAKAGLGPLKQLGMTLGDLGESIGALLLPVINKLAMFIKPLVEKLDNFIKTSGIFKKSIAIFKKILKTVWDGIKEPMLRIWNTLKGLFIFIKDLFLSLFKNFNQAGGAFSKFWSYLKVAFNTVSKAFTFIVNIVKFLALLLKPIFTSMIKTYSWIYDKILKPLFEQLGVLFDWLNKQLEWLLGKMQKIDKDNKDNKDTSFDGGSSGGGGAGSSWGDNTNTDNNTSITSNTATSTTNEPLTSSDVTLTTDRSIKNYTFNINNLVEELQVNTTELRESEGEIETIITNILRKAVLDVQTY